MDMRSRGFRIFVDSNEWATTIEEVNRVMSVHGVLHFWPPHAYAFFEMGHLRTQISDTSAFDALVRHKELDFSRQPSTYFEQPTVEGFIHVSCPRVRPGPSLQCTYLTMRDSDRGSEVDSPLRLFNGLVRKLKLLQLGKASDSETLSERDSIGYSRGALLLYYAGHRLVTSPSGSAYYVPDARRGNAISGIE